jgi:hypothetical protein
MRVLTFLASGQSTVSGLTLRDGFHGFGLLPGENGFGAAFSIRAHSYSTIARSMIITLGVEQGPGIGGDGGAARGGGIYNDGTLILNRCTLRNCIAGGGNGTPDPIRSPAAGNGGLPRELRSTTPQADR